jgi:oligoendopeptidase F
MKIPRVSVLILGTLVSSISAAQSPAPQRLTADLARYYFASPEAEITSRTSLESALQMLQSYAGRLTTGARLLRELQAYDEVQRIYHLHDGYLHLRCAQNRKDSACEAEQKLEAEIEAKTAFLIPQILELSTAQLRSFYALEPGLKPYRFAIEDMHREAGHVLSQEKGALLGKLRPEIADWQYDLYEQIVAGIPFGTVETNSGALDVNRQRNVLAANPDARVREEAWKRRLTGYASRRDLLAFALIHTVTAQNALAQMHHYEDAPSRKYENLYLNAASTRALLNQMAEHGEVAKRFEQIRAHDFQEAYNRPMQAWDLSAPQPEFTVPITSPSDLPRIFHEAFAGLGPEYQASFDELLNAHNGRADVVPGGAPDRYQGGFSIGFSGSTSMLFIGRYDGTFKDLSVIAHEGGHAAHRALMSAYGVRPGYAQGASFLFESFAMFNELILADYMAEHSTDPRLQRYYRERWMGIKGLDAFYGAEDALLEQQIYDGVAGGTIRGADDLDRLTVKVQGQFSAFPVTTPELRNNWASVSLMYEDPLYDVNYVYGGLLALKYYQLYTANRKAFAPRYAALLKNGFDAPPAELLKRFLNVDLFGPALLRDDLELLDQRLRLLEGAQKTH